MVLVAIGVGADGHRQIPGVAEGQKEDPEGWRGFLLHLKDRRQASHAEVKEGRGPWSGKRMAIQVVAWAVVTAQP